jgi:tight adherence protein C
MLTTLTDTLGPFGPLIVIGVLGVMLIAGAVVMFVRQPADPLDKLRNNGPAAVSGQTSERRLRQGGGHEQKLEKYATFLEPQNEEELSSIRKKLMQAGYRTKGAVRVYFFAQLVLSLGTLVAGLAYAFLTTTGETDMQKLIISALLPAVIGYMAPRSWVNQRRHERQKSIVEGFPDALVMMLVCVEAGQSMDQSIIRVSKEIAVGYPALAEEFELVAYEIKAGKDKGTVLRDMSERCGVADVASFVTVLVQSIAFGTPITDALRVYAEEMRDKRVMRAEEKANTLPTKMTLATMGLTVPPLVLILIGPSLFGIVEMFKGMQ